MPWLFGRKNRRKRSRSGSISPAVPTAAAGPHPSNTPIRRSSQQSQRDRALASSLQPPKTGSTPRYSFETGRADNLDMHWVKQSTAAVGAPPAPASAPASHDNAVYREPTLHPTQSQSKRDGRHLLSRTKSSKRRKNAHGREREAEIKAMTAVLPPSADNRRNRAVDFDPLRPAVEPWMAGRPLTKKGQTPSHPDSFAARTARGEKRLLAANKGKKRRGSDISLPSTECLDSAMSSDSERVSYVVSTLAALAPKPTLRYAVQPMRGAGGSAVYGPPYRDPASNHQLSRKLSKKIPEATLRAHKRVDDLADDMNASDIRQLMERDMRRRERRRASDQERAAERLARQKERQQRQLQREQEKDMRDAPPSRSSPDMARGVLGREAAAALGPGSDTTSAVVTSAKRRDNSPHRPVSPCPPTNYEHEHQSHLLSPPPDEHRPVAHNADDDVDMAVATQSESNTSATSSRRRSPIEMFYRPDSSPVESAEALPLPPVAETEHNSISQAGEAMDIVEPSDSAADYAASAAGAATAVPVRTNSKLRQLSKLRKRLSNLSNPSNPSTRSPKSSGNGSVRGHMRGAVSWSSLGGIIRWASRSSRRPKRSDSTRNMSGSSGAVGGSAAQMVKDEHEMTPEELLIATAAATEAALAGPTNLAPFHTRAPLSPGTKPGVHRTMSRFREDLPEFLMSPPPSRLQSPQHQHQRVTESDRESMLETIDGSPLPIQGVETFLRDDVSPLPSPLPIQGAETFMRDAESDEESIIMPPTAFHGQYHSVQPPPATEQSWLLVEAHGHTQDGNAEVDAAVNADAHNEEHRDVVAESLEPSPEPQQSLSLASIDSEGSWLSGGRSQRRRSTQLQRSLDDVSRTSYRKWTSNDHINNHSNYYQSTQQSLCALATGDNSAQEPDEQETVSGEADMSGLTKTAEEEEMESEQVEAVAVTSAHWGAVNQRKIQIDTPPHTASLAKSHEGLLNIFIDGEDGPDSPDSPESPNTEQASPTSLVSESSPVSDGDFHEVKGVQRATSVHLGRGHVRHISAGSAKLLDISPRNSMGGEVLQ